MNDNHKHYYAAHSHWGLNCTYDSPCWSLFAFDSKGERDEWVKENEYNGQNYVAESVDISTARKICPYLNRHTPHDDQTGYYTYNNGREVNHL